MRPRTAGRRLALQYLFMEDLAGSGVERPESFFRMQREAVRDGSRRDADPDERFFDKPDLYREEAEDFALSLIDAVRGARDEIDSRISHAASNWSLDRIGPIERNVIRMALAELFLGDTPSGVVMDEAIELAKRFGDRESGAFVNGVIDRLAGGRGNGAKPSGGEG
ncbi:MAG: transcription antitermination factor NusB [Planctomycetota bacterium]|nr:transcription antitermination factor NusB [Planctomycetota bacterium]